MLSLALIVIIWTWGLTPVWANIIATILLTLRATIQFAGVLIKAAED